MLRYLKNNRGWAMALVVILVAIVPIFVTALYAYSMSSTRIVLKQIELETARYLARSGIEAATYVWKEADMDDKPSGTLDRVYLKEDKSFTTTPTADEINASLGYVDVIIEYNTDSASDEYLTTKMTARARAGDSGQIIVATSLPYQHGNDVNSFYNHETGVFYQGSSANSIPVSDNAGNGYFYHDLIGVITCDADSPSNKNDPPEFFSFYKGVTGIGCDTIFFNDYIDLTEDVAGDPAGGGITDRLVYLTARKIVFRDVVILSEGSVNGSIILDVAQQNDIKISGKAGSFGAVYFQGGVKLGTETIISAGSSFYFKDQTGNAGLDILEWYNGTGGYDADDFFELSISDDNKFVPTENSSINFIYE